MTWEKKERKMSVVVVKRNRFGMGIIMLHFLTEGSPLHLCCTSLMWETTIVPIAYLWLFMATRYQSDSTTPHQRFEKDTA